MPSFELGSGLLAKLGDLVGHPLGVVRILILGELFTGKYSCLRIGLEPCEEERKSSVIEKFVLRIPAVLVHGFSYNVKVDESVLKELVILVVSVGEDKKLHQFCELECGLCLHAGQQALELGVYELFERRQHRNLLLRALPLLVERLVLGLEIECHLAEAGPLEVEVEVLVILLVARRRFLRRVGLLRSLLAALHLLRFGGLGR